MLVSIVVYSSIFILSLIYVPILNLWMKRDPIGFYNYTWFQVVIGITYTCLPLLWIMPAEEWLKVFIAFIVSAPPIIARSLWLNGRNNNELSNHARSHQTSAGDDQEEGSVSE